jgi:hypothetical protein
MEVDMDTNTQPRDLPPLWPFLLLSATLALSVDFSDFHRENTSDSLVPVLTSLYHWTPFYWQCNRIGMLVPLLAMPFRNPMNNLLVQGWLTLFAAFATFFLLSRYVLRAPSWPLAGSLASGMFIVMSRPSCCFVATFGQPHYCVALALAAGAVLLTEPYHDGRQGWGRLPVALILVLLAVWVNSATPVILAPLVVLRSALRGREPAQEGSSRWRRVGAWLWGLLDREATLSLGLLGASVVGAHYFHSLVAACDDPLTKGNLEVRQWPQAWGALAANTWNAAVQPGAWGFIAVAAAGVIVLLTAVVHGKARGPLRAAFVLVAGSLSYGLAIGTVRWVAANAFCFKYWIPVIFCCETALAIIALAPLGALLQPRRVKVLCALCFPALLLAVGVVNGKPSRARVRANLDRMPHCVPLLRRNADILASRATHVVGAYGEVWVSVFLVNLNLYERREDRVVWGVCGRGNATWEHWGRFSPEDMRLAGCTAQLGGPPDGEVPHYLRCFFPPVEVVEKRPSLWLFRPCDELPHQAPASGSDAVLSSWHSGFYGLEGTPDYNNRWCGTSSGKLTLTNTSDRPRTVTLHMQPQTGYNAKSNLWIESPLLSDHLLINEYTEPCQRTFTVPPGKHIVRFSCDTRPTPDPYALRSLYFYIRNVKITEREADAMEPTIRGARP